MTAIITGATGDIGKEFVQALYEEVDSIQELFIFVYMTILELMKTM